MSFMLWGAQGQKRNLNLFLGDSGSFTQTFEAGSLAGYTLVTGNINLFTTTVGTYGTAIDLLSQNSVTAARIRLAFQPRQISSLNFKFRVTDNNTDDAGIVIFDDAIFGGQVYFNPRREQAIDPNRAPELALKQNTAGPLILTSIGVTTITINSWYEFTLINTGSAYQYQIFNLTAGTLFASGTVGTAFTPIRVSRIGFFIDSTTIASTARTEYAQTMTLSGNGQ